MVEADVEIGGSTAILEFAAGHPLAKTVIRVSRDTSVRGFIDMQRRIEDVSAGRSRADRPAMQEWEDIFTQFATTGLLSWNVKLHGKKVPATAAGFLSIPFEHAAAIVAAWMQVLAGASPNTSAASTNGTRRGGQTTRSRRN